MLFSFLVISLLNIFVWNYAHSYRADAKHELITREQKPRLAIKEYCVFIVLCIAVCGFLLMNISYLLQDAVANLVAAFIFYPFLRWEVHDEGMNWIRGKPWGYLGEQSKTDDFLSKYKEQGIHPSMIRIPVMIAGGVIAFYSRQIIQNYVNW